MDEEIAGILFTLCLMFVVFVTLCSTLAAPWYFWSQAIADCVEAGMQWTETETTRTQYHCEPIN